MGHLAAEAEILFQSEEGLYDGEGESDLREKPVARGSQSTDEDAQSVGLVLTLDHTSVTEGAPRSIFGTVVLDTGVATENITVDVSVMGGTATKGVDYTVEAPSQTVIDAGYNDGFIDMRITTINDSDAEGDETIFIQVSAEGFTSGSEDSTIKDNVSVTLSVSPSSVAENVSIGTAAIMVTATLEGHVYESVDGGGKPRCVGRQRGERSRLYD